MLGLGFYFFGLLCLHFCSSARCPCGFYFGFCFPGSELLFIELNLGTVDENQ